MHAKVNSCLLFKIYFLLISIECVQFLTPDRKLIFWNVLRNSFELLPIFICLCLPFLSHQQHCIIVKYSISISKNYMRNDTHTIISICFKLSPENQGTTRHIALHLYAKVWSNAFIDFLTKSLASVKTPKYQNKLHSIIPMEHG